MSQKDSLKELPVKLEPIENLNRITILQQAAASCAGAIITSLFVTPLDVVKIRLQAQQKISQGQTKCFLYCNGLMDHFCSCSPDDPNSRWLQRPGHFNGTIDAFIKISRTEGVSSLWSGLSPTLVLALPATIVYFVAYEQLKNSLRDNYKSKEISNVYRNQVPKNLTYQFPLWIPLVSGAVARIISVSLVSPLELFRTKMQSQKLSYFEMNQALKALVKQNGLRGLWKGIFPTLYRDVPFSAIYWMNYESIKSLMGVSDSNPSFSVSFCAGAFSGSIAAAITTPFDVVKTHQQIEFGETNLYGGGRSQKNRSTLEIIKEIRAEHGVRGLFAGLVPRLIKVAPACAIMISSFEYGKVFFSQLQHAKAFEGSNLETDIRTTPNFMSSEEGNSGKRKH